MASSVLDTFPLMAPPAGTQSNFVNPVSNADVVRITTYVFLPIMLVFVVMRMMARFVITRSAGADDYVCLAASVLVVTWCGISFSLLDHPHGHHMWDVPVSAITGAFLKKTYAEVVVYICASAAVRVSIFILYFRLFGHVRRMRILIWAGCLLTSASYLALLASHVYYCTPRAGGSGWSIASFVRCADPDIKISIAQAIFGSFTDFFLFLLPIIQIMRLTMPLKKKLGVAGIFTIGLLALASSVACAVLRVYLLHQEDLFWEVTKTYAFGTVEVTVGIICCCMPVIPGFARSVADSKVWSTMSSRLRHWTHKTSSPGPSYDEDKLVGNGNELGSISVKKDWRVDEEAGGHGVSHLTNDSLEQSRTRASIGGN